MESELKGLVKISVRVATSMAYARIVSSQIEPGKLRLFFLLPVLCLFCYIPLYVSFISFRGLTAFFLVWLGNFRLLLLSFDSGPLSHSLPLLTFIVYAILPIKLTPIRNTQPSTSYKLIFSLAKAALYVSVVYLLYFKDKMHHYLLHIVHMMFIYLIVDVVLNCISAMAKFTVPPGYEIVPFLDSPLRSASLQEFWGQRWNLIVSDLLRSTVYVPIHRKFGVASGTIAAFLVSGLMHDLILFYIGARKPIGEVTGFFVLNGFGVVIEKAASRAGFWRPPRFVAVSTTLGFVAVTSFWLFFPTMSRNHFDRVWIMECQMMVEFVKSAGYDLLSKL